MADYTFAPHDADSFEVDAADGNVLGLVALTEDEHGWYADFRDEHGDMQVGDVRGTRWEVAEELGERQVRRFSDRETAERRVTEIVARAEAAERYVDQKIREPKIGKTTTNHPAPSRAALPRCSACWRPQRAARARSRSSPPPWA